MIRFQEIKEKHLIFCNKYLKSNIDMVIAEIKNEEQKKKMKELFNNENFKKLITSNPVDISLVNEISQEIKLVEGEYCYRTEKGSKKMEKETTKLGKFKEVVEDIFLGQYNLFGKKDDTELYSSSKYPNFQWNSYIYAQKVRIHICPYCNSEFIYTQLESNIDEREKIGGIEIPRITIRPQLDHFISKDSQPLLAISIFNLVPCCKTCNSSIKHTTELNLENFLNPLHEDIYSNISFTNIEKKGLDHYSNITGISTEFTLGIKKKDFNITDDLFRKAKNTINIFRILERYEPYKVYIQYNISRELLYSKVYSKNLEKAFPKLFNIGEIEMIKKYSIIDREFIFSKIINDFLE